MKDILKTLIRRSFAASRLRNVIAVLAIALTAVLFTSVTTMVAGTLQSVTLTLQIQKMSKSDGEFRYMSKEQYEAMRQADFIREAGLRMPVGYLSNSVRHNIEFDVEDEIQAELTFCMPGYGSVPQAANEIVASDRALRDLGVEPEAGTEVIIEFTAHGRKYSLPMVVSGWYEALNDQLSVMWTSKAFCDAYPEIFEDTYRQDGEMAGTYFFDFAAADTVAGAGALREKMFDLVRSQGGDPEDMSAPNYLPVSVNAVTNPVPDPRMTAMAGFLLALFFFCGYLLIYNVFDIAVMQEIRRYGLYRTIGMSRKQVRKLINGQAVRLSGLGIPFGMLVGFYIGKAALPAIMNNLSNSYTNIAVEVSLSPAIFIGAAALTALTVFLSTRKPVRVAANIPPIEAFHYADRAVSSRKSKKSALGADIPRLAWSNLGRNRRRTAFIMVSLTLCIVLLNCSGTIADSIDIQKQVAMTTRTDFSVVNVVSTSVRKGFLFRSHEIKEQTIADISARPGIYDETLIYKNTAEDADITFGFDHVFSENVFFNEESGLQFLFDDNGIAFGLGEDGRPICNVYGMEEVGFARMDLREGEVDAHTLYARMVNGEGVLVGVDIKRTDQSLNKVFDLVEIGDIITVYKEGIPVMELPVLAKAGIISDDKEVGFTANGPAEVGGDGLFLYLPSPVFEDLYDYPVVYKYSFNVEEEMQAEMTSFLEDYMKNTDTSMNYLSAESAREDAMATRSTVNYVGGLVGGIFGICGVLNLINTIITTILTRRKEFATMRSIGMTERQLTKMMIFEGVYYAAGACVLGLGLSALLSMTVIKSILDSPSWWFCSFHFTLLPALSSCVVLLAVSAVIPVLALKLFYKGSIVEELHRE